MQCPQNTWEKEKDTEREEVEVEERDSGKQVSVN